MNLFIELSLWSWINLWKELDIDFIKVLSYWCYVITKSSIILRWKKSSNYLLFTFLCCKITFWNISLFIYCYLNIFLYCHLICISSYYLFSSCLVLFILFFIVMYQENNYVANLYNQNLFDCFIYFSLIYALQKYSHHI